MCIQSNFLLSLLYPIQNTRRYLLVRIRENAESIAFYGGEDVESKEISSRLSRVIDNRKDINRAQRNLEFFTTPYHYLIQVVPIAVVAPQYFAGAIQLVRRMSYIAPIAS